MELDSAPDPDTVALFIAYLTYYQKLSYKGISTLMYCMCLELANKFGRTRSNKRSWSTAVLVQKVVRRGKAC